MNSTAFLWFLRMLKQYVMRSSKGYAMRWMYIVNALQDDVAGNISIVPNILRREMYRPTAVQLLWTLWFINFILACKQCFIFLLQVSLFNILFWRINMKHGSDTGDILLNVIVIVTSSSLCFMLPLLAFYIRFRWIVVKMNVFFHCISFLISSRYTVNDDNNYDGNDNIIVQINVMYLHCLFGKHDLWGF